MSRQPRRLLASIHDVGPRFEREVDVLAGLLSRELGGGAPFAMLVVPEHWGTSAIGADRAFCARLRAWSDAGVEMFVHGWSHQDDMAHAAAGGAHRGRAGLKARWMTAGEGEFLGLAEDEAARRMADGRAVIEDAIGRPAAGFIAPAWLYGPGARAALRASGFALAEDHLQVWRPVDGAVLARGPVITWASRSTIRTASSLAVAALGRYALSVLPTVRVAVHPGDISKRSILRSVGATLRRLGSTHAPARYADLLADRSGPPSLPRYDGQAKAVKGSGHGICVV